MSLTKSTYLLSVTLVAAIGGLLFGYDTAVISGTTTALDVHFIQPFGLEETIASTLKGFTISSALIGCVIGGLFAGILSKKFGRKNTLTLSALLFLMSAAGSAFPEFLFAQLGAGDHTFLSHFIVYRIIGGVGVGIASMVSPMYISEIAPANMRGRLVSFNQFAIIFGMLVVYFVNYGIAIQGDDLWLNQIGWRYMFLSEVIPAAAFLLFLVYVPESPRYLVINNQEDRALHILAKINGMDEAKNIIREIQVTNVNHHSGVFAFGTAVVIIGILLSVFQQFVGINVVLYYAPDIFRTMGANTDSSLMQTIIVGAINLSFTVIAINTVDRFGRKPLMAIGALGMAISMIALGICFYVQSVGMLALTFMLTYTAAFAVSWGPVCWVLLAEIFPNKIRSIAMSIAVAAQWIANWFVSVTFPVMNENSWLTERFNNGFAFWVYGVIGLIAAWFVLKYVPETKNKTLEQMESIWSQEQTIYTNGEDLQSA